MTTTYPQGGTTTNESDGVIFGIGVSLGNSTQSLHFQASGTNLAVGDRILGYDLSQGVGTNNVYNVNSSYADTIGSVPSGYSALGVATYGDGQIDRSTVWASDHEVSGVGEFNYHKPLGPTGGDYVNLT